MKRTFKDWLMVLGLLADDVAIVAAVYLLLFFLRIPIPWWFNVIIALAVAGFAYLIHKSVIPALRRKRTTGAEGMLGLRGTVTEPLTPHGTVRVRGESWNAKSIDGNIVAGREVEVIGIEGLTLKVTLADHKHIPRRKQG